MNSPSASGAANVEFPSAISSLLRRPDETSSFVIFGASGDLTRRKLIPALYNLECADLLPPDFQVIGFGLPGTDDESFKKMMAQGVQECREADAFNPKIWEKFARGFHYITADFTSPEGYQQLRQHLEEVESKNDR